MARLISLTALIAGTALVLCGPLQAAQRTFEGFPFTIPYDGLAEGTAPAELAALDAPAGEGGFIQVQGDRFVRADTGEPIRFWATNLCFAGCFPPHEVARRMARRLGTLGINCVRFHHMDAAGYPNGIWRNQGWGDFHHTDLHPEALDRLDFLVAELKRNGVYADLNLHVSRRYSPADGFPEPAEGESVPGYGKGMDHFYPRAVEEQKRYAGMLLRHENAYTGNPYAEEPAVAIVEVNNENGLLQQWAGGGLDALPEEYRAELEEQWNEWLRSRYGSTPRLADAWSGGAHPGGGPDLLAGAAVEPRLEVHEESAATVQETTDSESDPVRVVNVQEGSSVGWHVQHHWAPLTVKKGTAYELRIRMRANRRKSVSLGLKMDHEPWRDLAPTQSVTVGPQWRQYSVIFQANADEAPDAAGRGGARVSLSNLAETDLEVAFTEPTLRRAAVTGLPTGQNLEEGTVAWPERGEAGGRTQAVWMDMVRFLRQTEVGYWSEMRRYLKEDLGVRMAVTGTATGFTTPYIAAETGDFVDAHAYWQHPHFPGRSWDMSNWRVGNVPMVSRPEDATLGSLAGRRIFGLPFTVTEYNHSAPNEYAAEGFPLIAVYGSRQRWDGVFQFAYSHNDRFETDHFSSFFDMKGDPAKLAVMPACSVLFRGGLVPASAAAAEGWLSIAERLDLLLGGGPWRVTAYSGDVPGDAWRRALVGLLRRRDQSVTPGPGGGKVTWHADGGVRGVVHYVGDGVAGLIGFASGQSLRVPGFYILTGDTSLDGFAVVMLNAVDGQALGEPGRYLLSAVSRYANPGMQWNDQRNSVGTQWGRGPTRCEGVPMRFGVRTGRQVTVYPLNPDGTRRQPLEVGRGEAGVAFVDLGPEQRTLWYEVVVAE
ncbi:MAG: carbohydrate binding domain-containing protein [Candidatus Brocadiia bacterium]